MTDTVEASHWLAKLPGSGALPPFTRDWKAYWLRAGDDVLSRRLDAWLLAREADGRLQAWRDAWFGEGVMPATALPAVALEAAGEERLALMPFVAGYKRANGLGVVDAEREARVLDAGWKAVEATASAEGAEPPDEAETRALSDVCLLLFNSNEFMYIY